MPQEKSSTRLDTVKAATAEPLCQTLNNKKGEPGGHGGRIACMCPVITRDLSEPHLSARALPKAACSMLALVLVCSCNSPPAPLKTTILCPSPEHATSVRAHTPKHNFLVKSHCYLGRGHTRTGPVHMGQGAPAG